METKWIDFYKVLEVPRNATEQEIKASYKRLMKKYHPDLNQEESSDEKTKEINEAYDILGDKNKKEQYDIEWDNHQIEGFDTDAEEPISYEEAKKNYSEAEQKVAEKIAFETIVDEELEKSSAILDAKNSLISNGVFGLISKREYHETLKELMGIYSEYLKSLKKLASEAYDRDCLVKEETIYATIQFLETEMNSIPLSIIEAKELYTQEQFQTSLKNKAAELLSTKEKYFDMVSQILLAISQKEITVHEYHALRANALLELQNYLSEVENLAHLCKEQDFKREFNNLLKLASEIHRKVALLPSDFQNAANLSQVEVMRLEMIDSLEDFNRFKNQISELVETLSDVADDEEKKAIYATIDGMHNELIKKIKKTRKNLQRINEIPIQAFEDAKLVSTKADSLYNHSKEVHHKSETFYDGNIEIFTTSYGPQAIKYISDSAEAASLKSEAIDLYIRSKELIDLIKLHIYDDEYKGLSSRMDEILKEVERSHRDFQEQSYVLNRKSPYTSFAEEKEHLTKKIFKLTTELTKRIFVVLTKTGIQYAIAYLIKANADIIPISDELRNIAITLFCISGTLSLMDKKLRFIYRELTTTEQEYEQLLEKHI